MFEEKPQIGMKILVTTEKVGSYLPRFKKELKAVNASIAYSKKYKNYFALLGLRDKKEIELCGLKAVLGKRKASGGRSLVGFDNIESEILPLTDRWDVRLAESEFEAINRQVVEAKKEMVAAATELVGMAGNKELFGETVKKVSKTAERIRAGIQVGTLVVVYGIIHSLGKVLGAAASIKDTIDIGVPGWKQALDVIRDVGATDLWAAISLLLTTALAVSAFILKLAIDNDLKVLEKSEKYYYNAWMLVNFVSRGGGKDEAEK